MARHHNWAPVRAAERPVGEYSSHGQLTLGLAYANSYHVGMSSLGFQRVYDLVHRYPDWSCERLFADGEGPPVSVETETPLNAFGVVAFSVSFEEDYVNLLQMLRRARVPQRREDRRKGDPLILMGGSCAEINPLTMSAFVDVFALGVSAYQLCCFEFPWPVGDNPALSAMSHDTDTPVDLREHRPDLDPDLAAAIMSCLAAEPRLRPQTVTDFLRLISEVKKESVD